MRTGLLATGLVLLVTMVVCCGGEQEQRPVQRFPVVIGARAGYMDRTGEIVIPPKWHGAHDFSEGLAPVKEPTGRWGFIDSTGQMVIPAGFHEVRGFSEGLAAIKRIDRWAFIDKTGKIVLIPKTYPAYEAGSFVHGVAPVRRRRGWTYIKRDGFNAFPRAYEEAHDFSDGLAAVRLPFGDKKMGFIDISGAPTIRAEFDDLGDFGSGLAPAYIEGEGWGYIDRTGEWAIEPQYTWAGNCSEGLAAVATGGHLGPEMVVGARWKYIDRENRTVFELPELAYGQGGEFFRGLAPVQGFVPERASVELWYVDREGTPIHVKRGDNATSP